jgi:hypothetical protein
MNHLNMELFAYLRGTLYSQYKGKNKEELIFS